MKCGCRKAFPGSHEPETTGHSRFIMVLPVSEQRRRMVRMAVGATSQKRADVRCLLPDDDDDLGFRAPRMSSYMALPVPTSCLVLHAWK